MNDTPEEPAYLSGLEVKDSSTKAHAAETEQATKALLQAVADLKAENADLRDRNLRIIAEMENFRRRCGKNRGQKLNRRLRQQERHGAVRSISSPLNHRCITR